VTNPARLSPRATESCNASSVRSASTAPYLKQLSSSSKVLVVNGGHKETAPTQIGFEAPACDQDRLAIDLSRSYLQCKNGLHFHDGETRDYMLGTPLGKNPINEVTADLPAVELGQCARVEEVIWQSALSALFNDSFRKRTPDRRQRSPDFIKVNVILRGVRPFLGGE
jgi:hypothetical protein